jgi:DNA repair exonuclease SbcCD nuclease subunit
MRFLHAADLHLGLRVTRFGKEVSNKVREARFQALENVLRVARDKQVEMLLIAGDLFDDNHVDARTSRGALEILESLNIPVYVLPGNHDPLTPDSVWERPPWKQAANDLHVLRTPEPVMSMCGAVLLPCPLTRKTSLEDPTAWIPPRPVGDAAIRIGIAHGSLRDRDNLPEDDHLIARHVVDDRGLDYLALGHWHRPSRYADRKGEMRTVYPGVHEPMRFSSGDGFATGWTPYSNAANADLFADDGKGRVVCVSIERSAAEPVLEEIDVSHLTWEDETHTLAHDDELSRLISNLAGRNHVERRLLRLRLVGVLSAQAMSRLDALDASLAGGEGGGVLQRYCWADMNIDGLHTAPDDEDLRQAVGTGVLRTVYDRLCQEEMSSENGTREKAERALTVLYRLAREVRQ